MARVAKNLVLHGASGKIGDMLVIRQRAGNTILAQAPGKRDGEMTEKQKEHIGKFQQAVLYGRSQIADADSKAEYVEKASGMKSAYNIAVADFFHAPDIDEIDLSNYSGAAGDTIRIRAMDDFRVEEVKVSIFNGDGSLVEEGLAVQDDNELDWIYTATARIESLEGDKIVVSVSDKPGNVTEEEAEV
jgi:hypothetical protein